MEKILRTVVWVGVALILVGVVSCNIPFFTPDDGGDGGDGTGDTTGASITPSNPDAPANTDGAETILIPGGVFWMGSEATDEVAGEDEMPRHQVKLDGFYIYTHEVTNGMYAECAAAGPCAQVNVLESGPTMHYSDPAYADYPVVGVDWNMADAYCKWVGGRLPTEAEWEMASRGSESLTYPWGEEDPDCDRVNMLGCAVPPDTVEVGSYLLGNSPEGVWDLSGNAWEWVHDWYADNYYLFSPMFAPLGPYTYQDVSNPLKVVRGGGLFSEPDKMRSAERVGANPYRAYDDVGFRCVTPPGGPLPEAYIPTRDRHERVPTGPDGGERLDDPDGGDWIAIGTRMASCPTMEGLMYVLIAADSSVPGISWDVTVEGNPFSCTYNDVAHALACLGPVPANNDELTRYAIEIHTSLPGGQYSGFIDKPTDCDTPPPAEGNVDIGCPEDGLFNITFTYYPPIAWNTVQLAGVDIACVPYTDVELRCTAPDLRSGDHYQFHLLGTDEVGRNYEWNPWIPVRDDCPVGFLDADLSASCFEGLSSVEVYYMPEVMGIDSVSVGSTALDCIGMAPNVFICTVLPGAPGDAVDVEVCTDTGACFTETVVVTGCPGNAGFPGFLIEPYCYPPEAPAPAVSIHYWPFDVPITTATVDVVPVSCSDWGGGWYVCPGVPGSAGDTVAVIPCLEDGRCFSGSMIIPDCGTPPPGGNEWRMLAIGCHDETRIYFQIDTSLDWLVPGADFDYNAGDGETSYACTVNPATPGRVYCSGTRPLAPGPLQFCLLEPGHAELTCGGYEDWPLWVGGVPPCAPPEDPEEPPPGPSCSDYTNPSDCGAASCYWDKMTNTCNDTP